MANNRARTDAIIPAIPLKFLKKAPKKSARNNASTRSRTSLMSLPDELLLNIASYLYKPKVEVCTYLCDLSLVCKRMAGVAQECLYCAPKINKSVDWRDYSRTTMLARTLLRRPDLAHKLQRLQFEVSTRPVEFETGKFASCESTGWEIGITKVLVAGAHILKSAVNLRDLNLQFDYQDYQDWDGDFRP